MSHAVEFVQRFLAALQGGRPLPPDSAFQLERALRALLTDPDSRLDESLGLRRRGQSSIAEQYKLQLRDEWVRNFYAKHHRQQSRNSASMDIADNLDLLRQNRNAPLIDACYKELFDRLSAAGIDPPSQRAVYDLLRNS